MAPATWASPSCAYLSAASRVNPTCGGPTMTRLVGKVPRSGVPGLAREHAEIDADLLQRLGVLAADILAEDQIGVGSAMQPTIVLDLVLQLARSPAGIAECEDRAVRSLPARDRLENVEGSSKA